MRMTNDGLQPWFSDRKKFGLRPMSCRESSATEEGLATLNTVLNSRSKYLWKAALTYCEYQSSVVLRFCVDSISSVDFLTFDMYSISLNASSLLIKL